MANIDEIFDTIVTSLETANNEDVATAYAYLVGCGDCPYWHECQHNFICDEYILKKLEKEE